MSEYPTYGSFPILPIRNTVLFPGVTMPLRVGRLKSVAAIEAAEKQGGWLLTVTQRHDELEKEPTAQDLFSVGVLCKIEKMRGSHQNGFHIIVRGAARFHLDDIQEKDGYFQATASEFPDEVDTDTATYQALSTSVKDLAQQILKLLPTNTDQLAELVRGVDDLGFLSHLCAANLEIELSKKQDLLEARNLKARVLSLLAAMAAQKDSLQIQSEIRDKLSNKMNRVQREAILREHLKAIREELGEGEDESKDSALLNKIEEAGMPPEVKKVALEENKRLAQLGSQSPESHVVRNYLELLCAMPWSKHSAESIDLEKAKAVLDRDHYGLDKIKKRILEHLAVLKLRNNAKGSILLFVGPPGVGKTSLGQSIATALGRKFVRGALGGLRDDAEIRGHRRTYVGAMPGRIIQGLKKAGTNNPVFILDEIDKLSRSFQGDPGSALLEVLDPEQNANFQDHYLDVPFDLSKVFFIATANSLENIPGPLLDRMEVIELTGYTTPEKLHIAKQHLVPKELEANGLKSDDVQISDEALLRVISHYTREAGVRELQRIIGSLFRATAVKILQQKNRGPLKVELSDLDDILGPEKYMHEVAERLTPPGVVTGLAWTPQGGEILFIEAGLMPGAGHLTMTGQLGEVMKESAQIALSLVRSRLPEWAPGLDFKATDLHIHVPAGAIPKDGPSAGIAIFTAIASLYCNRSLSPTTAMTGEVTLRGAVMPVGGIKEKVIAAHRAGIQRIILSQRNKKDLRDVPSEVKDQMKFEFVDNVSEVLKIALDLEWKPGTFIAGTAGPGKSLETSRPCT